MLVKSVASRFFSCLPLTSIDGDGIAVYWTTLMGEGTGGEGVIFWEKRKIWVKFWAHEKIVITVLIDFMMKRLLVILTMLLTLGLGNVALAEIQWHETNREVQGKSLNDPRQSDGVEIYGRNGVITIVTPKRVTVRVYTILGQLLSQATLPVGTSELKVGSRGIYLVRIGNLTQKVAI